MVVTAIMMVVDVVRVVVVVDIIVVVMVMVVIVAMLVSVSLNMGWTTVPGGSLRGGGIPAIIVWARPRHSVLQGKPRIEKRGADRLGVVL